MIFLFGKTKFIADLLFKYFMFWNCAQNCWEIISLINIYSKDTFFIINFWCLMASCGSFRRFFGSFFAKEMFVSFFVYVFFFVQCVFGCFAYFLLLKWGDQKILRLIFKRISVLLVFYMYFTILDFLPMLINLFWYANASEILQNSWQFNFSFKLYILGLRNFHPSFPPLRVFKSRKK